jgi:hypothetical protein
MKICPNCGQPINRVVEDGESKMQLALTYEHGKNILNAIKRHLFRSIDLCNFCYATLQVYRIKSK